MIVSCFCISALSILSSGYSCSVFLEFTKIPAGASLGLTHAFRGGFRSGMICCNCCHEWYHGNCVGISVSQADVMSRDNEKYVCPLCLQSSSDQFIQWPIPDQSLLLFSGASALVLSFVTLYLMYMMKLYTGNETYSWSLLAPLERLLYWSFLTSTKHMQIVQAWNPLH